MRFLWRPKGLEAKRIVDAFCSWKIATIPVELEHFAAVHIYLVNILDGIELTSASTYANLVQGSDDGLSLDI